MKKIIFALLLAVGVSPGYLLAQQTQAGPVNLTAQGTTCGAAKTSSVVLPNVINAGSAVFTIGAASTGSWTVTFYGLGATGASGDWSLLNVFPSNSTTPVSSATGAGTWQANGGSYQAFCMMVTTYSSGTVVAAINDSPASAGSHGSGGGGGSGTVTQVNTSAPLSGGPITDSGTIACSTCAVTGVDINSSSQVTATHLAAALPVNQGGTGTASTLTGVVRGGSPLTASEMSGDCTTSGSNALTCTKINNTAFAGTNGHFVAFGAANIPADSGVADTGAGINGLIQNLTGCNTATYVYTPQAADCVPGGVVTNAQTGTTYTYLASDRLGYTTFSNASPIAAGLPQAGTTGFTSNWVNKSCNIGAGTVTITPTTSTISYTNWLTYTSGASSVALTTGQCIFIYSDNTNYFANLEQLANLGTPTTLTLTNATGLPTAGLVNNAVTSAKMAVVNTRRTCDVSIGDESASSAIANAQLGPQKRLCYIPAAATVVEMDVDADGGTPNVIAAVNHAGSDSNIVSSALATAATGGIACSNTGGTTGINGATTCSSTLQNTSMAAGDYLELVSGTAGGTAKLMNVHVVYTVN